jgi:hypothetical protein
LQSGSALPAAAALSVLLPKCDVKTKPNKSAIPVLARDEALRAVEQFNRKELAGTGSRYVTRFRGKFLYLDRADSVDLERICRLEYAGPKRGWYFAIYKYSDDRYDEEDWFFPGSGFVDGTVRGALKAGMEAYS